MARGRIPMELIEAARVAFLHRLRAWEASEQQQQQQGDAIALDLRVAIASNVTPAMLKRIPDDWLTGMAVALRLDGVLELMDVETTEHNMARAMVMMCVGTYATHNHAPATGLRLSSRSSFDPREPDCVLSWFPPRPLPLPRRQQRRAQPLVVADVQVSHQRSVGEILDNAAHNYFSNRHVQRVVVFKFLKAKSPWSCDHRQQQQRLLYKPALALVLERGGPILEADQDQPRALRVLDAVSFGTAPQHYPE